MDPVNQVMVVRGEIRVESGVSLIWKVPVAMPVREREHVVGSIGVPRIYVVFIAPDNIGGRVRFEGTGGHSC